MSPPERFASFALRAQLDTHQPDTAHLKFAFLCRTAR